MRVLVVDDHALFRDGIVSLLEAGGHQVVGQARNGEEAVRQALALLPDLVLMDLHMPEKTGLQALREIKEQRPEINVVLLTVSEEDDNLLEAIRSGANGYLLKQIDSNEFYRILKNLARGDLRDAAATRTLPSIAMRMYKILSQGGGAAEKIVLTDREMDVLRGMSHGRSNREIAGELSVSENTIRFHVKNILQKLSVTNRKEAVVAAQKLGIL